MNQPFFPFILVRTAGLPPLSLAGFWPDEEPQKALERTAVEQLQQAFDAALPTLPDSPLRTAVYNARKRFFQQQKVPGSAFEQLLFDWKNQPEIIQLLDSLHFWRKIHQENQLARSVETTLLLNWRSIQQAAEQPTFRQALLFASHDLLERLPAFCARSPAQWTAKDRQTALAVLQYWNRAAHKTSPFSRFTSVSLWRWEPDVVAMDPDEPDFLQAPKAIVTPNVALLPALYDVLVGDPAFYQSLTLALNPALEQTAHSALQWLYFDGEHESFQQLAFHPIVEAVVEICLAHERHIAWPTLIAELQTSVESDEAALQTFVFELIALGLLAWQWPEKGMHAGWCSGLYNYLGYLPTTPRITKTAALLQWLRTAARTLPFQSVAAAMATQRETWHQVQAFLEEFGLAMPPMKAEQIFFEDVEQRATVQVPAEAIRQLTQQLAECWQQSGPQHLPVFRSALYAFSASAMAVGESQSFLAFSRKFLEEKATWEQLPPAETSPWQGKIGALLQIFRDETGQYRAVVNGLFPGGGKLLARWLHLFPAEAREQMQAWFPADAFAYPWQDWSNANFQPPLATATLAIPDGRVPGKPGSPTILLADLVVQQTVDGPRLLDRNTGKRCWMLDMGLEAPTARPPVMQVLWQLGVPFVSLEGLWPAPSAWQVMHAGWQYRPRQAYQSLVLSRAAWRIAPSVWQEWLTVPAVTERLKIMRRALIQNGLPQHFFARFSAQKPQYFDRDSPANLLLLAKMLRSEAGDLYCTEMLPWPEQAVVEQNGSRAAEFVVEC